MNTENTLNRAYAQWLKDGIFEIGFGFLLAGVGTLRAIIHFAGEKTAAYYWLSAGLLVFMIGGAWGFKPVRQCSQRTHHLPAHRIYGFQAISLTIINVSLSCLYLQGFSAV